MPATARNAISPPFHPQAARESDRLDRHLDADAARTLLSRIERLRREEEIRELRGHLADVEFELRVVKTEKEKAIRRALAQRIKAYIARVTGEAA